MEMWQIITAAFAGAYLLIGLILQRFGGRYICDDSTCPREGGHYHLIRYSAFERGRDTLLWGLDLVIWVVGTVLSTSRRAVRWVVLGI